MIRICSIVYSSVLLNIPKLHSLINIRYFASLAPAPPHTLFPNTNYTRVPLKTKHCDLTYSSSQILNSKFHTSVKIITEKLFVASDIPLSTGNSSFSVYVDVFSLFFYPRMAVQGSNQQPVSYLGRVALNAVTNELHN